MHALPTELNALTKCASGKAFCNRSISDSIEVGEEFQHAVLRRRIRNRVGRVDHRLARKVRRAGGRERIERHVAFHRQHDELAELGRVGEACGLRAFMLREEILQLAGVTGAECDLMPVLDKSGGERLRHITRS